MSKMSDRRGGAVGLAATILVLGVCGCFRTSWAAPLPRQPPVMPASPHATAAPSKEVLKTFAFGQQAYELSLENCAPDAGLCTFALRLLEVGKEVHRIEVGRTACVAAAPPLSAGMLPVDPEATVWTASAGKCRIALAARTAELAAGATALLVTEQTEREAIEGRYWRHALYLPRQGQLALVWSHEENIVDGDWTSTAVIRGVDRGHDIAIVQVGRAWKDVVPSLLVRRMHLPESGDFMLGTELPDGVASLFVVQVGNFKSGVEMSKASAGCLHDLAPLAGKVFPRLALPAFFLGGVYIRRDQAEATAAAVSACHANLPVNVVTWSTSDGATGGLPSKRSVGVSEVRAFDWKNAVLPLENGDTYPFSRGLYSLASEEDSCQVCMHIRAIAFGDVDGDGKEETLLAIGTNLGGAGTDITGYVFGVKDGKPIWRATVEGGDRGEGGIESMKVEHGVVVVRRFESLVHDGVCCPSRIKVERWRWVDRHLQQAGPSRLVRRRPLPWFRSP